MRRNFRSNNRWARYLQNILLWQLTLITRPGHAVLQVNPWWNAPDNTLTRFHTTYSLDQHCYHEGWTKWLGLEGSHCATGCPPNNIWKILNIRTPQRRTRLNRICHWRRTDAEDCPLYWGLLGTPRHQSGLSQRK